MAAAVQEIFHNGPQAVIDTIVRQEVGRSLEDIDIKLLADLAWTRANTLDDVDPFQSKKWADAALAGYEFLEIHAKGAIAESAGENAEMLRGWDVPAPEARSA